MAFWPFGKKKAEPAPTPEPAAPQPTAPPPAAPAQEPELLLRARGLTFDSVASEHQAADVLAHARGTPLEPRVLEIVLERLHGKPFGDPIRVQIAHIWTERGERERAERMVAAATSAHGLFVAAELAEQRGDLPTALARLERVLARDVDYPGARERHRRLRAALGVEQHERKVVGATALVPQAEAPYKLLREVARGGSGAVYEAEDANLMRLVALKLFHDPVGRGDALLAEMRVVARLSGPGVIRVYDADAAEGWLAFEWAALGSLRELLRQQSPQLGQVRRWLPQIARGLSRIHAAGVVHGDIKPANLLFVDAQTPVWSDFGLATTIGAPLAGGSRGYMTPDRMRQTLARPWHDIYGIGRICEELAECPVLMASDRQWLGQLARACLTDEAQAPADGQALCALLDASAR